MLSPVKGYETFLPTYIKENKFYKKSELPLFPSYIFCRLDLRSVLPVLTTPGVFSIVGGGRVSGSITEGEISSLKCFAGKELPVQPWPYLQAGTEVTMTSGPFQGVRGTIVDSMNSQWLVVSVNILQRAVAVRIDRKSTSSTSISILNSFQNAFVPNGGSALTKNSAQ